ncbi:MAG: LamG-like jellyroll fold domain-containing protein [Candidatus Spyradenecus sp.]
MTRAFGVWLAGLLACLPLGFSAQAAGTTFGTGVKAYYSFNGISTTVTSGATCQKWDEATGALGTYEGNTLTLSGSNYTGTCVSRLNGGDAFNGGNSAVYFNGKEVDFAPADNTGDWTIGFWFHCGANWTLFTNTRDNKGFKFTVDSSSKLIFHYHVEGSTTMQTLTSSATITACTTSHANSSDWNYVAVVRKGDELALWLNGEKSATADLSGVALNVVPERGNMTSSTGGYGAQRGLDDLTVWTRALSENEVKSLTMALPEDSIVHSLVDIAQLSVTAFGFPAEWTNGRAININFSSQADLGATEPYGEASVSYLGSAWNQPIMSNDNIDTEVVYTGQLLDDTGVVTTMGMSSWARTIDRFTNDDFNNLLRGSLVDSGSKGASVKFTNIPYATYDVYVYMVSSQWPKNGSVTLNGSTTEHYYMAAVGDAEASVASASCGWGTAYSFGSAELGKNVLHIADLSGQELTIATYRSASETDSTSGVAGCRGCIAAIQIVERVRLGDVWTGTVSGTVTAADVEVTAGSTTKPLSEVATGEVELTLAGDATLSGTEGLTLTSLKLKGAGTLTLGSALAVTNRLTVMQDVTLAAEPANLCQTLNLSAGSQLKLLGGTEALPGTYAGQILGAGAVEIASGAVAALSNAANDFAGGTVVNGTLQWQGVEAYGPGAVTVNARGVFDLNGLRCTQALTLNGGTLKGSVDAANAMAPAEVFSVNFNQDQGKLGNSETGGLVPMLGSYWMNTANASGTNQALTLVPYEQIAGAGASTQTLASALSWTCRGHWANGNNQTSYLKGYLDENSNSPVVLTFTLPEIKAMFGYDLYLYANTDTGGATFSAKDVTGDDGVTTSYTYSNGALVTGSTAGFGNSNTGTTTVAEGTNVLKLSGLTDRSLQISSPNRNGRGCIAAVQGVFYQPKGYAGALTVAADSVLEVPEVGKTLYLAEATVSGSGKLTKQGAGELRLEECTFGAQPLTVAEGSCTVGEGNTLSGVNVTVASGAQLTAEAGVSAISLASLSGEGTVELGDLTVLTLAGSTSTATFEGSFTADTRDAALADAVCALIKQGTNTQVLSQLPDAITFEVQAQAGTLKVFATTDQTLSRLVTTGGTFATDGLGEVSVEFAQMASGAANFASRATAASARPAMESAGDATVSKFTLAEGGKVLYQTRADLAKSFPAGFIPEGDYTLQLGADLYSELSYPYVFTVMGADANARFTVLTSTGYPAPEGSWSASGNTITISDSSAITGEVLDLGAPKFHYTFDLGNLDKASDVEAGVDIRDENCTYADSDNGKCLASGTPYANSFTLPSGAWSFGTYFRSMKTQEKDVLFGFGQRITPGALYLAKGAGNTATLWHNPTGTGVVELFTVQLAGSGETWNHLLLTHTEGTITCYVNGEQVAVAKGDFAKALSQFQIGSMHGGVGHGFTKWSGRDGQVDDLAVWHSALVGKQVTDAAAKVMGKWRWREGETPAEALDATATDWQTVDGIPGAWPGTEADSDYTAAVTFSASATLEELFALTKVFTAREVLWDGAQVSFVAGETALELPENAPRLAVANEVVVDLAGAELALFKAACSTPAQLKLADGAYSGEVTLRNVPEGLFVTAVAQADGLYAQVSQAPQLTANAWEWILSVDNRWDGATSGTLYGLDPIAVYGEHWNEIGGGGGTISSLKKQDGTASGVAVTASFGGNVNYWANYSDKVKKGYAAGPSRYTFTNLPAGEYAVALYAVSPSNVQASPVRVSDATGNAYYTYRNGALQRSAEVPAVAWGQNNIDGYVLGQNTIVMPATANAGGSIVVEISDSNAPTGGPGLDWQTTVGRGFTVGIQLAKLKASEAYERTLTGNANWNEADAWTKLADGTTVDTPPAGATVFLTVTADATLTMGTERPELMDLFIDGAGALTLDYGTLGLTTADDYANAPFERTLLTVENGLPEAFTLRTSPLNFGAYAKIARTESAVVATVNAPEGLWQETGTERILSINFSNDDSNKLTGTAQEGLAGYEVHPSLWSQFTGASQTDQTIQVYNFADRANGSAAGTEVANALTYTAPTTWYVSGASLFKGYLDDGTDGTLDNTAVTVTLPNDWSARYTAVVYRASSSNNMPFTPQMINGVWYSYVGGVLTALGTDATVRPAATYDWGSTSERDQYVEGSNTVVVSGLTDRTFSVKAWTQRGDWYWGWSARGGLAAIQLKEEKSLSPGTAKTFIAEAGGNVSWASLTWRDENGQGTGETPGASDAATIVLTGDLSLDLSGVSAKHLTIYGNGHKVRFSHRNNATIGSWAFVDDTTLELTQQDETLPENTVADPKRIRYAYPYSGDVTTTARYEQEFAAGYTGTLTPQGGLVEFSGNAVQFTGLTITGTETDFIFSGNAAVTLADGVPFSFGTANLTFKDTAKVVAKEMRVVDAGPGDNAYGRTVNLTMQDDATITITGSVNNARGSNSLLWPHWAGTLNASLRGNAKLISEKAALSVGCADGDALQAHLTLADSAEVRVAGLYGYGNAANTLYDITLKGGKLLIGSAGMGNFEGTRPVTLNFQGGAFGVWQDLACYETEHNFFSEVTGNPIFANEATLTMTRPAPFFANPAARATLSSGGLVLQGKDFAVLPSLTLANGTALKLENCSPALPSLTLAGGSLELAAGFPTVESLTFQANSIIRVPLRERLAEGGYITMANNRQVPALTRAVFELALDPNRSETSRVLPLVPLVLGNYTEGEEPQVKGFGVLNNTNSAISDYAAVFQSGSAGRGLYASLKGNEVLKGYTVRLNGETDALPQGGYPLIQSTLEAYPYHIFSCELPGAKIVVPEAGVALPHAAFIGNPITLVATSSTPGTLLQGVNYTFSTDVTFDLSAWAGAMPTLARGAVKGVPASICLVSGGVVKAPATVRLKANLGTYTLPDGVTGTVETTAQGVYYVVRYERRVRTLSVNFTESTVPLVAPPAQVGAYGLPIAGWNSLEGVFSSANLLLSDIGGVAQAVATAAADPTQPTQLVSYASQTNVATGASVPLLQVRLEDSTAQQLRVVNVPFEAYRVVLIFANDLEGAAYATATINGSSYAMDAEGYTRRDIAGYLATDAKGNPTIDIPADTQWGSTNFTPASAPVVLGTNALVSDVLTTSAVTIELPGFTYAQCYAGLAALQILEAPDLTAAGQILSCAYTFPADGENYVLADLALSGTAETWTNGPENSLFLTSDYEVTLTLPEGFEADRIVCSGAGSITLRVAGNGGAALRALEASQLANITVDFPATGVDFAPAIETSRFEQAFDNKGLPYTIAVGATLALGEHSGIITEFDDNGTANLDIDESGSRGVLRRDYPVTQTGVVERNNLIFAFKQGVVTAGTNTSTYSLVVEEGDSFRVTGSYFPNLGTPNSVWSYTQTGGQAAFEKDNGSNGSNGGVCFFINNNPANSVVNISLSGNADTRLYTYALRSWTTGVRLNVNVSDEATLSLGNAGFYAHTATSSVVSTFTGKGTLEAAYAELGATTGRTTTTFNGGRLTTQQPEANFTLPLVFTGTEAEPTIVAPNSLSTILLSGANSGSGKIVVEQGTLAVANGAALAQTAVTVKAGATFEARALNSTRNYAVTFEAGSTCSVTTSADPTYPHTAQVAGTLAFPADLSTVAFRLNGTLYTIADSDVDTAAGTVTFRADAQKTGKAITWDVNGPGGEWTQGSTAPWVNNDAYEDGDQVTFPENPVDDARTVGPIVGHLRPGALTMPSAGDGYTFTAAGGLQGFLDLRDCVAADNALNLGGGVIYDVPIALASPAVTLKQGSLTLRLLGVMSNDNKTATLVGSGDLNGGTQANHGVWAGDAYNNDITWAPHAGETQILSAFGAHFAGNRTVTIAGQVAADGSVSGGTVKFAGHTPGTNWNGSFNGQFKICDGATVDFTMTRAGNGDNDPYFRVDANSLADRDQPVFTLSNGATLRISGCRNILGGYGQKENASLIARQPIVIGYKSTLDYRYTSDSHQVLPYGLRFNGDGATLQINEKKMADRQGIFIARGATLTVAGIGDEGDLADPATDKSMVTDPNTGAEVRSPTYGQLTRGITATIAGLNEHVGLVRLDSGITGREDIALQVGEGSTLRLLANLTHPGNSSSDTVAFYKQGKGRLTLEHPTIAARNTIVVKEGVLGGVAELTHANSAITVENGATIEGGLRASSLTIGAGATLALDATGVKPLRCDNAFFTANGTVTVASLLPEGEIPSAAGREPVKVMSWNAAQAVDSVNFVLSEALANAGYGLQVRNDGLYLMRNVVYVRELSFEGTPDKVVAAWFSPTGWYRQEDPATKRDFDPAENETATALFLLPADRYAADGVAPALILNLTREANFSTVRVGVKVSEQVTDEAGNPVTDGAGNPVMQEVVRLLQSSVTYSYVLTNETMPGAGEAYAFTWVSTRLVEGPAATSLAGVTASVPTGYAYTQLDTTVVVYASATSFTPALNLNFTGKSSGDPAWVSLNAGNCGAVPYAGVYWNNLAANGGDGTELVAEGNNNRQLLRAYATVAGVTTDEGLAATCEVAFISSGAETVASRRGDGNVCLAASFLKGQNVGNDAALLNAGGLTAPGVNCGWQVMVKGVPFKDCDLYLLFAGAADGEVTYPAVRVKVGSGDWRTYSVANGFVAPADRTDVWRGRGSLVSGNFVNATNMLHLRLNVANGEDIEVCSIDGQLGAPASVGLAAMQIVQCADGVSNDRLGTGNWSDPAGWARETSDGQEKGRWLDATDEAPRWAKIPTTSYLTADMVASTPYLRITGGSDLLLNGSEGVLSTGTVDLYTALERAKVTFAKNLFAAAPNVVMAPNVTVCLPESAGATTCDYRWVYDDMTRAGTASTEATIQKTQSGDLTLARKNLNKLQIDDGTLWLSSTADGDYTRSAAITGQGILGKTGIGAVTLAADSLQLEGVTGVHVSQGTLNWIGGSRTYPAGQRHIVDGGTLYYDGTNAGEGSGNAPTHLPNAVFEVSNGGIFRFRGNNALRKSLPSVTVKNATVESNYYGGDGSRWGDHPHIGSITLQNGTVSIVHDSGWFSAWTRQGLVIHGSLNVESGSNNRITLTSDKGDGLVFSEENSGLVVAAGATITSHVGIAGVNLGNDTSRKFTKRGPGTWIQAVTLAGPGLNVFDGVPIDVEGGTFSYRIGGATHTLADGKTDATITVKDGARLEGNVVFTAGSPIVIEEGGTLAPYVPGVASSSISAQKLTLNSGAILEFDLANTTGGALKNAAEGSVTFVGDLTVRLVNLPNTLTNEVQLTNFTVAPTTAPTISCPEAVALDATVQYKDDTNGVKQLFLVPSGASYTWADQEGKWSETLWRHSSSANPVAFPGGTMSEGTPPARVQASATSFTLAVDKGSLSTVDGKDWAMTGLVLTAAANRTITLSEALEPLTDPLPSGIALNRLLVKGALWKLGAGSATVAAPIAFYQAGEGSVNLAASKLTLKHPLLIQQAINQAALTTVPVPIDIAAGATLEYALEASEEERKVIAAQSPTYTPTSQTLSGEMTGAGTLRLSGANNTLTLTGKVDNSLAYEVTGQGATLTLSGTIPETTPAATRTLTLAAGASLSATTESAFGWAPWAATLAADATSGAKVATSSNARFRGSVEVTGTGTATFGTAAGYLDGSTVFNVPANASLALGGSWQSPDDVAATDTLTKRGAGTLAITGNYSSNLPLTVEAGTVEVSGSVYVDELNPDVLADWTLESGATLRLTNANSLNLNKGSLLVKPGATLDLAGQSRDVIGQVALQSGAVIRLGAGTSLGKTTFKSAVSADGTIWVNLDALDPATFGTASGTKSYTILTFEDGGKVNGTGVFRLGGEKQVAWAQAGWTLRTSGSDVILEAFGGNSGVYTWAGTDDAHAWNDAVWVLSAIGVDKQRRAWPSADVIKPYVAFLDKVIVANSDNAEVEESVSEAAHTIPRALAVQTLGGLRCANDDYDYTLSAEGVAGALSIDGELLKTGEKALTLSQALTFGSNGALKLLGGVTRLEGALASQSGDFKKPLTLAGNAELAFRYTSGNAYLGGLFTGDGTGTLRFSSPGSLTVAAELKGLKTLAVDKGSVLLTAAEQLTLAPEVQLAEQATLAYNPSTLAQGGAVKLRVNPTTAAAGILSWGAGASNETAKAPRLTRAEGVPDGVPSINVAELRYAPASGHLILDPGHAVLPASAKLTMNNKATGATAFWMGASTAQGSTLDYAGLSGSGLISVEPVVDPSAESAWRTTRTLTLRLDPANSADERIFRGTFAGALTLDSTRVDAALSIQNAAPNPAADPIRFTLAGASESAYLGALTIGECTRVDVTGSWFGPVSVNAVGGELGGSGTVASGNNEVTIPEGGLITASAIGPRVHPDGTTTTELVPTTLTVGGTLSMVPGSKLRVVIRNNAQEVAETSCVQAERLRLPTIVDDPNNEVKLQVIIDDELGAVASNTKILGWNTLDGASKISGVILGTDGSDRSGDYVLRQKSDGLYLYRSNTRFWLFVR